MSRLSAVFGLLSLKSLFISASVSVVAFNNQIIPTVKFNVNQMKGLKYVFQLDGIGVGQVFSDFQKHLDFA